MIYLYVCCEVNFAKWQYIVIDSSTLLQYPIIKVISSNKQAFIVEVTNIVEQ